MSERIPRSLRMLVRQRAHRCSEYCLIHEEDCIYPHEPDHIIACKHGGETSATNLAHSCALCNSLKGSDIASIDLETGRIVPLFHPRADRWREHFRLAKGLIVPLTPTGRATEFLLQFNRSDVVVAHRLLIADGRYPRTSRRRSK